MSEELSRVEDLLENGVEEPVLPMSELEAILRGEKVKPHSRVAELLLQYNPQDILIEKSITENGTYYASVDNADGYFKVIVDTPVVPPTVLDHLVETITENGEHTYTPEHDGYSDATITVNVPRPQPVVASKTITENDTYVAADEQLDGYSQVVVNVPPTPLDTMNITHNGTYHPPAGRGFDEVNVAVPLGSKSITANGTYTATDDNLDGYSSVAVDVPQIGIKDIPNTPTPIATFSDGTSNPLKSLTASIVPVQDLHGYDSPWAGGAGKNKLQVTATTQTVNGITYTVNDDGTINANGTANADSRFSFGTYIAKAQSQQIMNGLPDSVTDGTIDMGYQGYGVINKTTRELVINRDADRDWNNDTYILIKSGTTVNNLTFKPMIRLASETDATFAPYSNICPISGWTEEVIYVRGINQWDEEWRNGYYLIENGNFVAIDARVCSKNNIPITPNTTYYIQAPYSGVLDVIYLDADGNYIGYKADRQSRTFTTPSNCHYIKFSCWTTYGGTYNHDISINYPSTDTEYHAYAGTTTTIPFVDGQGQSVEVFGGSVNVVNGVVTPCPYYASYNGEQLTGEWISDRDVYSPNTSPTIGAQVVNIGATGTSFNVQPTSIKSLDGENNVFASTGDVESGQYFGYVYPELGTKTITENGTYTAMDDNLDGYSSVTVDVPSGGNTPIVYHYSNDRKICVGENTIDGTCTWYFMGYYLAENDTAPPAELLAYLPSDDGVLQSENYVSNQDLTQNGWCGFYNRNLRLWTLDTSALQTGYLWGVVNTFEKVGTVHYPQHNGYFEPV